MTAKLKTAQIETLLDFSHGANHFLAEMKMLTKLSKRILLFFLFLPNYAEKEKQHFAIIES